MPASSGVHGPGEMTIASASSDIASSTDTASLRRTITSAPIVPSACTRFPREGVVVVDQQHAHAG